MLDDDCLARPPKLVPRTLGALPPEHRPVAQALNDKPLPPRCPVEIAIVAAYAPWQPAIHDCEDHRSPVRVRYDVPHPIRSQVWVHTEVVDRP